MTDLRTYLNEIDNAIFRPEGSLSVIQEITALQHELAARNAHPVILVQTPRLIDGSAGGIPVLTNLFASRAL